MTTDTGLIERAAEVYRELGDVLTDEERWTQTHFLKARNIISDLSDRVSVLADEVLRASMAMLRKNNGALLTELSRAPEAGAVAPIASKLFDADMAKNVADAELFTILCEKGGIDGYQFCNWHFDGYDDSIEFDDCNSGFRLSPEHRQLLWDNGFARCWLNHADGWETYYSRESPGEHRKQKTIPASPAPAQATELCSDCPPAGYPTDKTRCDPCPRATPPAGGLTGGTMYHPQGFAGRPYEQQPGVATPPAVCHVCGEQTETACADCQITFSATVYVCSKASCRDAHERKCFGPGNSAPPPAEARELVERAVAPKPSSPATSELVAALRRMVDDYENYSDERSGEPSCPICTEGATPNHLNKGPCAYHHAKALIAKAAALPAAQAATLPELLEQSAARFKAMTPEEQEAELKAQRESWVRGEMGFGSDKDEAAARLIARTSETLNYLARNDGPSARETRLVAALTEIKTLKSQPIGDTGFNVGPTALFQAAQRIARDALKERP